MINKYLKKDIYLQKKDKNLLKQYNNEISKNSQQNNSKTVTNENDKEMTRERYISLEKRQKKY